MRTKSVIILLLCTILVVDMKATIGDTFKWATTEGVVLTYKVTNETYKECMVGTNTTSLGVACETSTTGAVTIPASVNGYSVTSIGFGAFNGCRISSISIPNTVKVIYRRAFDDCIYLQNIFIPSSVTNIAAGSGFGGAFSPKHLTNIVVDEGNSQYDSRNGCNAIIKKSTQTLIYGCDNTIIPNDIKKIGEWAFGDCQGLTNISIPEGIEVIGESAFRRTKNLVSLTIPQSMKEIDSYAFSGCSALTSVVSKMENPFTLESVVFENISSECILTVPHGCRDTYIAAGWTESVFKGGVVETPSPNISFADAKVKALCIANWDTNGDGELSEAEAAAVTSLGTVFKSNTQITSFDELQYFTKLTSIEEYAFYTCSNLTTITIPNSVVSIGDIAFWGCNNLTSITIPSSVTSIGKFAFSQCNGLTTIIVKSDNTKYDSRNNCNAIIETSSNTLVAGCKNTIIPNSVTSIGNSAFRGSTNMTDFIIPNNITSIGDYAFMNCSALTSITIPNSVTSIGNYAFDHCTSLISVTIPNSVTSIGNYAFASCSRLTFIISAIEKPFAFGNKAFNGIASTCTLTVPAGTEDAYIAAGWTENIFKGGIIETASLSPNIAFADAKVKALCVANWDTNGDGELSEAEAAAVTSLGTVFKFNAQITSFDELQYFTGITSIGKQDFMVCEKLTSVTIPNNIKSIGNEAFNSCYSLTSVNIPNSVTDIGVDAFGYCKNLTSITIPQSVTNIGEAAFYGCGKLTTMNVDERNTKYDSRNHCNAIIETSTNTLISGFSTTIIPNSVTSIANYAFAYLNNSSMTSIVIPNSVKKIGKSSFRSCSNLTSVEIPNSVESIGDYAFYGCKDLTSITIPNSLNKINEGAFGDCSSLTSITIPKGVKSIGNAPFSNCKVLTSVISEVAEPFSIDNMTFNNISSSCTLTVPYGTKEAYIAAGWTEEVFKGGIIETTPPSPNIIFEDAVVKYLCVKYWDTNKDGELSEAEVAAVTTLGDVFRDDDDILYFEELKYFTGLTSIGSSAFYNCTELEDVIIPNSVTSIGSAAFYNCHDLEYVIIPNSVTSIGSYAFGDCEWLSDITIPSGVTCIGDYAFNGCKRLTSVISEIKNPFTLSSNAFNNISTNCLLIIPNGTKDAYIAKGWTESIFKGGIVEMELPSPIITFVDDNIKALCVSGTWDSNGDGELSKAEAASVTSLDGLFRGKENITSFNEFEYFTRLKSVENNAFQNCVGLTSITLPKSVTSIGSSAFSGCKGLTSVIIPNGVRSIDVQSFSGCTGLASVIIPNSVTSIGVAAFNGCNSAFSVDSENTVYDSRNNCNAIIETTSNTLIAGCSTTTIPNNVKGIGDYAFFGCSSLFSINIPCSVISIGKKAFSNCGNLTSVISEIEEPCVFGSDAFSGIPSTCTLTVPYGTKEAYISKGWTEDVFKGGVVEASAPVTDISQLDNAIYIEPFTTPAGEDVQMEICLKNAEMSTGYQFDLVLPEGMSIAVNDGGEFNGAVTLSSRNSGATVATYKKSDNIYSMSVMSSTSLTGDDGCVLTVKAHVQDDIAVGTYPIGIVNSRLIFSNFTKLSLPDTQTSVTVTSYRTGDVNDDGEVDLLDAVLVLYHSVGKPVPTFIEEASDVNGDGESDLLDAVLILYYSVGKISSFEDYGKKGPDPQ